MSKGKKRNFEKFQKRAFCQKKIRKFIFQKFNAENG